MTADSSCTTEYFIDKILLEVYSSHLHASFGTFCVQIAQLFEVQRALKHSQEFKIGYIFLRKRRFVDVHTLFKGSLQIIDQFGRKRFQAKLEGVGYKILKVFFKNIFC